MAVSYTQLQHTFASKGINAGTTATVVLQTGWLITCANVGDSLGFIDTGAEVWTNPLMNIRRGLVREGGINGIPKNGRQARHYLKCVNSNGNHAHEIRPASTKPETLQALKFT